MPKQFRISDFHLRKASEAVPAAPEHSRFSFRKIPRSFQNDSGTLQELSGMCQNQFDLMVSPETTFQFYRNSFGDLSLRNFSAVSENFLSNSLSSIQQIDDPEACDPIGSVKYRHDPEPLLINDQHRSRGHPY